MAWSTPYVDPCPVNSLFALDGFWPVCLPWEQSDFSSFCGLPRTSGPLGRLSFQAQGVFLDKIRIEHIALDELEKWPRNPKDHDLSLIQGSISRFGFVSPILIDETTGKIVAGHGRLESLQKLKQSGQPPPCARNMNSTTQF